MDNLYDVVIVGGGPAGLTAALYLARAKYRVLVLEKEQFGGQIAITHEVVNYPGIAKTSGKALTDTIQQQAESFGAEFILTEATGFDLSGDIKTVHTNKGDYRCFGILLATGAHPRTIGFKGEEEHKGRGVAYCATCDGNFFRGREVCVVGGGNTALEDALYLSKICTKVYLIHRRDAFRGFEALSKRIFETENIVTVLDSVVESINGEDRVSSVTVKNVKSNTLTEIPISGCFIAVGMVPNTGLIKGKINLTESGHIDAGEDTTTNLPGVFAAGDVRTKELRQVITAASDGATAAHMAGEYLA